MIEWFSNLKCNGLKTSGDAIVSETLLKPTRNRNAIQAAILNRVLDRGWALNRKWPLR